MRGEFPASSAPLRAPSICRNDILQVVTGQEGGELNPDKSQQTPMNPQNPTTPPEKQRTPTNPKWPPVTQNGGRAGGPPPHHVCAQPSSCLRCDASGKEQVAGARRALVFLIALINAVCKNECFRLPIQEPPANGGLPGACSSPLVTGQSPGSLHSPRARTSLAPAHTCSFLASCSKTSG